jgi:hypothetical protein
VANSYYVHKSQNLIVKIKLKSALEITKEAARGTELAVQKFKAEVLKAWNTILTKISRRQRIELIFY